MNLPELPEPSYEWPSLCEYHEGEILSYGESCYREGHVDGFNHGWDSAKGTQIVRTLDPMTEVADKYAHRMAMVLECADGSPVRPLVERGHGTDRGTNMTEHKHAEILRAIADGKEIEYSTNTDCWSKADLGILFRNPHYLFRIKPDTVVINGVECPATSLAVLSKEFEILRRRVVRLEERTGTPSIPTSTCNPTKSLVEKKHE